MKNNFELQQIADHVRIYVERFGSQNKAANSLKGISSATLSQVLNNNWGSISDEMWRSLASQTGFKESGWVEVETRDYRLLTRLLTDSQQNANVFAITGESGTGKSYTIRRFVADCKTAHAVVCREYWNRKMFLSELLAAMGRDATGLNVSELMHEVVRQLKMQDRPVLIIDEADKLSDQVLYFFITLYNELEDRCGIVLIATDHLAKRIRRGLKLNKKGYKEIYSRIARRSIELQGLGSVDITMICQANGVTDCKHIKEVIDDAEGDLRRVKRKIHALKIG
ncbi:MAG: ATP-binding protein [Methylotenera sp.]|nr:ATP-binding protein [Methylotenera sp.]